METRSQQGSESPSIVDAVRRSWWIVAVFAIGFGVLGFLSAEFTGIGRQATATVVVEDPRTATVFSSLGTGPNQPERYVNDQVAIMASTAIADATATQLRELGYDVTTDEIIEGTTVTAVQDSNVILVTVEAPSAELAIDTVNALVVAYEDVVETLVLSGYSDALAELDAAEVANATRIETIAANMASLLADNPELQELYNDYQTAIVALVELQKSLRTALSENQAAIRAEINDVSHQIELYQTVAAIELSNPQIDSLNTRLGEAIRRESDLLTRREQLAVDAALLGSGVVVESRAVDAEPTGSSTVLATLAGLILGATIGVAVAYWRSTTRRRFESKREPEDVLKAPLLVQIPGPPRGDDTESNLPSVVDPASAGGDAYRTLVDTLQRSIGLTRAGAVGDSQISAARGTLLAVVSARSDEGRAAVAVNAAFEAARSHLRVLLIDGDADGRKVSQLLYVASSHGHAAPALEAASLQPPQAAPIRVFELADGTRLDTIEHEPQLRATRKPFDPAASASALHALADHYDLVIIDEPPLLDEASSGRSIAHADRALVVVSQESMISDAEDVRYRLDVLGVDSVGYVYRTGFSENKFNVFGREPDTGRNAGSRA